MQRCKTVIVVCLLVCGIAMLHGRCAGEELDIVMKDGEPWATVTGTLVKVNMSAVKGAWEEYAIKQKDNEIIILIGEKVSELEEKQGSELSVSGVLKPRMIYAGVPTVTLEIREIKE